MMDFDTICTALKDLGVVEVILEVEGEVPYIEFNGFDDSPTGGHFKIKAMNADFAEKGI